MSEEQAGIDFDVACRDRQITLNYAADRVVISHPTIDVCSGYTVTINIVPKAERGSARTKDHPSNAPRASWLNGSNDPDDDKIVIAVPKGALPKGQSEQLYKYDIEVDGAGSLDPYFRVIR